MTGRCAWRAAPWNSARAFPPGVLATALTETVAALRHKGRADPLKDHAYLTKVVRTVAAQAGGSGPFDSAQDGPQTATVAEASDSSTPLRTGRGLKTAPTGPRKTFGAITALDDL